MSALDAVRTAVAAFAGVVGAAGSLDSLSTNQLGALRAQGSELLEQADVALTVTGVPLDTGDPTVNFTEFADYLLSLSRAAGDCSTLSDIRGLAGRAVFNINTLTG